MYLRFTVGLEETARVSAEQHALANAGYPAFEKVPKGNPLYMNMGRSYTAYNMHASVYM